MVLVVIVFPGLGLLVELTVEAKGVPSPLRGDCVPEEPPGLPPEGSLRRCRARQMSLRSCRTGISSSDLMSACVRSNRHAPSTAFSEKVGRYFPKPSFSSQVQTSSTVHCWTMMRDACGGAERVCTGGSGTHQSQVWAWCHGHKTVQQTCSQTVQEKNERPAHPAHQPGRIHSPHPPIGKERRGAGRLLSRGGGAILIGVRLGRGLGGWAGRLVNIPYDFGASWHSVPKGNSILRF